MVKRTASEPRENWTTEVESLGFDYHSKPIPYWDESACYVLEPSEADRLAGVSNELHQMCLDLVDHIVREGLYERFDMPVHFIEAVEQSWRQKDLALYGRFDFALDAKTHTWKLLEYNSDTPEILLESSIVQKQWQQAVFPNASQFNHLDEALLKRWEQLKTIPNCPNQFHFMTATEYRECVGNIRYMASVAQRAGFSTEVISAHDFLWDYEKKQFVREDDRPVKGLFKIYPWEWMFGSGVGLIDPQCKLLSFEPPWKYLPSNKSFLALLWKKHRNHPNLLPTYFIPEAFDGPLIKKAICSRNSEQVFYCVDPLSTHDHGPVDVSYIYQAVCPILDFKGKRPIFGAWMVDNQACGLGIRDDIRRISTDANRFVPHIIT